MVKEKEPSQLNNRSRLLEGDLPRGFRLFIAFSLILHVAFFVLIAAEGGEGQKQPLIKEKPIVARLVRLGEKKPPNQLPRIPTSAPQPEKVINLSSSENAAPVKKDSSPTRPQSKEEKTSIWDAFKNFDKQQQKTGRPETPEGDPMGDPLGNASVAREGDRYLMFIERTVRSNWEIPAVIPDNERVYLKATVVIYIDPTGKLLKLEMESASGNSFFDASLTSAITKSSPFSPPPSNFAKQYQTKGIGINFRAIP